MAESNIYRINLPYIDRRKELVRVIVDFDEGQEKIVNCKLPSGKRIPITSSLKKQLHEHLKKSSARW